MLDAELGRALGPGSLPRELDSVRRHVHRLKGTAGTYGLAETSAALEGIGERLDRLRKATAPNRAALRADLERLLRRARGGTA